MRACTWRWPKIPVNSTLVSCRTGTLARQHYAQRRARVPILLDTKTFIPDTQYRRGLAETLGVFRYLDRHRILIERARRFSTVSDYLA